MDSIFYVIDYVYNLASSTVLTFGNISFSLFSIWICMGALGIVATFVYKVFDR